LGEDAGEAEVRESKATMKRDMDLVRAILLEIGSSSMDNVYWMPVEILWAGHEKAKERVLATTGTLSLEAKKIALPYVVRQLVG
jgi:hypothetical protein